MSDREKMYRNANLTSLYCGDDYVAERMLEFECTNGNKEKCKTCDKVKTSYPPFTAEKQIELIKLLANHKGYSDYEWLGNQFDDYAQMYVFEVAIAKLTNDLWQDLTEEEKQQIKEILE